jgi:subtilisin family serine protease
MARKDRKAGKGGGKSKGKDSSKLWSLFSMVSAIAGATVAKKVLNTSWKAATGKEPPANPADPDVAMAEAVAWAAASGTLVALARMLATRRAASYYQRSTGHLPPQLQADAAREVAAQTVPR